MQQRYKSNAKIEMNKKAVSDNYQATAGLLR